MTTLDKTIEVLQHFVSDEATKGVLHAFKAQNQNSHYSGKYWVFTDILDYAENIDLVMNGSTNYKVEIKNARDQYEAHKVT